MFSSLTLPPPSTPPYPSSPPQPHAAPSFPLQSVWVVSICQLSVPGSDTQSCHFSSARIGEAFCSCPVWLEARGSVCMCVCVCASEKKQKGIQGTVKQLNGRQLQESWGKIGSSTGHTTDCKYHITLIRSALYHYVLHTGWSHPWPLSTSIGDQQELHTQEQSPPKSESVCFVWM